MRVKICGITNREDALAAVEAGADALGFILYPGSKRFVHPGIVAEIIAELPPFVTKVGVVVNASLVEIRAIEKKARLDVWQLHGDETPGFVETLSPRHVIKALPANSKAIKRAADYPDVQAFLLDTPSKQYGGTGKSFDWSLAAKFRDKVLFPLILSGGLNPENVAKAIKEVQPYAVDVSSGVESSPGIKDHRKLRNFIRLCKKP